MEKQCVDGSWYWGRVGWGVGVPSKLKNVGVVEGFLFRRLKRGKIKILK